MKSIYLSIIFICLYLFQSELFGQTSYYYPLTADYTEASNSTADLFPWPNGLGQTGTFVNRSIPVTTCAGGGNFLGYEYETNAGLSFDIPNGFMNCEYSIQFTWNYDNPITGPGQTAHPWIRMFSFGYTDDSGINLWTESPNVNGKLFVWHLVDTVWLGFWSLCVPDTASLSPLNYFNTSDYYRLTFTRNCSDQFKVYVNGSYVGGFVDHRERYIPQAPFNKIVFFRDTVEVTGCYPGGPYPNEASSGFIKDLVISNHELSATDILNDYSNFCPTVLPIDWKFVQGEPTQEGNLLQWQVNFPEFINYFEIERKKAEGDFSSIGNIDGGTNYSEDFFFLDQQPDENIAYYRIKAVDLDGNISFSKLIELTSDMPYKLYPNPAKDFIWVNVSDDTQRNYLEIYSVDGRKWKTVELKHNHNKISISDLPDGVFILKMNGKTPLRIVKTR